MFISEGEKILFVNSKYWERGQFLQTVSGKLMHLNIFFYKSCLDIYSFYKKPLWHYCRKRSDFVCCRKCKLAVISVMLFLFYFFQTGLGFDATTILREALTARQTWTAWNPVTEQDLIALQVNSR